jgi:hypothetical protein
MAISRSDLEKQLWDVVLETVGSMQIHPGSEQRFRYVIELGAKRMIAANRVTNADILTAKESLRRLVGLMMHHAAILQHPDYLGEDTFDCAGKALVAVQLGFALWPFWPLPGTQSGNQ